MNGVNEEISEEIYFFNKKCADFQEKFFYVGFCLKLKQKILNSVSFELELDKAIFGFKVKAKYL